MKKRFFVIGQSGFTIVNLMVGIGIGGIVLAGLAAALSLTFTAQRQLDQKTVAITYVDLLARTLAKPANCARALAASPPVLDLTGAPVPMSIAGNSLGSSIGDKMEIEEMTISKNMSIPTTIAAGTVASVGGFRRHAAFLNVKLRNVTAGTVSMRTRTIPFRVVTDATNTVVSCATETPESQVCEATGSVWDPAALVGEQCRPPTGKCLFGGSFSDPSMAVFNGGFDNTYTGDRSCLTGFTAQKTGSMTVMVKTGKEDYTATTYPVYSCLRCQNNATLLGTAGAVTTEYQDLLAQGFAEADAEAQMSIDDQIAAAISRLNFWW